VTCKTCKHWTRWRKHSELAEQHLWGDCDTLLDAPDLVSIWSSDRDGEWTETNVETHEDFSCKLHDPI